jgi:hypothetical protein
MTTQYFPSGSKLDMELSTSRRKHAGQLPRIGTDRSPLSEKEVPAHATPAATTKGSVGVPYPAPSNINWILAPHASTSSLTTLPHDSSTLRRSPRDHRVRRSASLSTLYSQPSLVSSSRSLQLGMDPSSLRGGNIGGPASRHVQPLSPIYEQHSSTSGHTSSDAKQSPMVEPTTPASFRASLFPL